VKLISASINNFRLLKSLDLNFSTDEKKSLTVIRAANETGKTTCQTALMWCLYGSKALPNKGDYSLFPSDEIGKGKEEVDVSVEIDFELDQVVGLGKGNHTLARSTYRLSRVCVEKPTRKGEARRSAEAPALWKITSQGTERVLQSEVAGIIENALPESLKGVYFTDGDSAMSFIEAAATQGVKRKRVTNAIEALLGLNVLERTIKHLSGIASKFSQEIDNKDYAADLEKLNDAVGSHEEDIEQWQEKLENAEVEIKKIRKELSGKEKQIEDSLKLGDKDALLRRRTDLEKRSLRAEETLKSTYKSINLTISSEVCSRAVLKSHIEVAKSLLNSMSKSKQLPKVNVPILEELLDRDFCFCGANLKDDTTECSVRRASISKTIEASRESDIEQEAASSLFYQVRSISTDGVADDWIETYTQQSKVLMNVQSDLSGLQKERESIESTINEIDDSHLQKLREQRDGLNAALQKQNSVQASKMTQIDASKIRLKEVEEDREKVRRKLGKTNLSAGNWDIANAVKNVFDGVVDVLRKEELQKVSAEMNRIFLAMIGADSANSDLSLIRKAELTDEFDIVVYGPNGHQLNPDQDLNGASRRAITLAFILALTKVSEVEAPNIIDTPLGMMAGYVKQSVLLRTIEEGTQVILFLTHDEIRGVEEILDKYAGTVFTLTNPGHYPKMLANKPSVNESGVVRCDCNHHEICVICERKGAEVV